MTTLLIILLIAALGALFLLWRSLTIREELLNDGASLAEATANEINRLSGGLGREAGMLRALAGHLRSHANRVADQIGAPTTPKTPDL